MKEWICEEIPAVTLDNECISTFMLQTQELVRCKDCKYSEFDEGTGFYVCQHPFGLCGMAHRAKWFCADGERKDS